MMQSGGEPSADAGSSSTVTGGATDAAIPTLDAKDRLELYYLKKGLSLRLSRLKEPHLQVHREKWIEARNRLPDLRRRVTKEARLANKKRIDKEADSRRQLRRKLGVQAAPLKKAGASRASLEGLPTILRRRREYSQQYSKKNTKAFKKATVSASSANDIGG
jgi:hypothetical protein